MVYWKGYWKCQIFGRVLQERPEPGGRGGGGERQTVYPPALELKKRISTRKGYVYTNVGRVALIF